jgi:2-desacetyl-2-hydroxyethyl bacteriochlorophyllide A dehydrogenase
VQRQCVWFEAPFKISVRDEVMPSIAPSQVLVQTMVSAISAGTELLFYRDQVPPEMSADSTIGALSGQVQYPLRYGYACVGRVIETGKDISADWRGRIVFAFQPHTSHFAASPEELIPVPDGITPEQAGFLPNMETAVNLVMDGAPIIGERVVVLGQGIIGLLVTRLLAQMPLAQLITLDRFELRRETSRLLGATETFDSSDVSTSIKNIDADLTYELTGHPDALNRAIELTGFDGRIIIGSWYGQKRGSLDLGGKFHRSRIRLISSQVSTIAPQFTGRWDKARRMDVAWAILKNFPANELITHRVLISDAARAYELLDQHPEQALQVVLTY